MKESQELSSDDSIIGMECLAEMNVLAVATRNGDMLSISTVPPNEVSHGASAACSYLYCNGELIPAVHSCLNNACKDHMISRQDYLSMQTDSY